MSTFRRTTVVTWVAVASFSWFGRAEAATVSVRESAKSFAAMPGLEIAYAAGNGERNRVVVRSAFAGSPWTITDSGATITAGPGCTTTGPHAASCRSTPSVGGLELLFADLWLRDLDDEATIVQPDLTPAFPLYVAGGAGDDVLTVGDPYGELYGGPGDDLLTSTAGLFTALRMSRQMLRPRRALPKSPAPTSTSD